MTKVDAAEFRPLAPSDMITNDDVVPYYLDDRNLRISVARVDDHLYAFDDLCTCASEQCPLSGGLLIGTTIMCQCHGSHYDIGSGDPTTGPATKSLAVYEVREADGEVQVRV